MPKRPPTPPTEATGKYLIIHQPYPGEPNMELLADRKVVAFWISNCLGSSTYLTAMYHKPKSDMIILEIRNDFGDYRKILGEHRWGEFIKRPSEQQKTMCSQIFFCRFQHDRDVQKHGWRRVDVKQSWYQHWNLINGQVVHPYPTTHFCETPAESPTSEPMCRPLPVEYFPRPPRPVEVQPTGPPGSFRWLEDKAKGKSADSKSAWFKGSAAVKASSKITRTSKAPATTTTPANPATPAIPVFPPGLSDPSLSSNANPWTANSQPQSAALPIHAPSPITPVAPGLQRLNTVASSNSGIGSSASEKRATAWGSTPSLSPASASTAMGAFSDGGSARMTPSTPSSATSFEQSMAGLSVADGLAAHDEEDEADWGFVLPSAAGVSEYQLEEAEPMNQPQESLWANYGNDEDVTIDPEQVICAVHGLRCKKGICAQRKSQIKELEREKEAPTWRGKQQKGKTKTEGARKTENKDDERGHKVVYKSHQAPRSKPAHLVNPAASQESTPSPTAAAAGSKHASVREKPVHLSNPAVMSPTDPDAPRPPRGRRMNNQNTAGSNNPTSPSSDSVTAREKPAHLSNPTAASPVDPNAPRLARGRRMNNQNTVNSNNTTSSASATTASPAGDSTGWGHIPLDKLKAKSVRDDAKSIAMSSTGGWGKPPPGPWDVPTVRSSASKAKGKKKTWAEQMEEEDDHQSVCESTTGGWGTISNGPWS